MLVLAYQKFRRNSENPNLFSTYFPNENSKLDQAHSGPSGLSLDDSVRTTLLSAKQTVISAV